MSKFLDNPNKILKLLEEFSNDQLRVLFGYKEDFNNWFKKQNIIDKVFNKILTLKNFILKNFKLIYFSLI
jgi:hypothetical protein